MQSIEEDFLKKYGVLEAHFPDSKAMPTTTEIHILPIDLCHNISSKNSIIAKDYATVVTDYAMDINIDKDDMKKLTEYQDILSHYQINIFYHANK